MAQLPRAAGAGPRADDGRDHGGYRHGQAAACADAAASCAERQLQIGGGCNLGIWQGRLKFQVLTLEHSTINLRAVCARIYWSKGRFDA